MPGKPVTFSMSFLFATWAVLNVHIYSLIGRIKVDNFPNGKKILKILRRARHFHLKIVKKPSENRLFASKTKHLSRGTSTTSPVPLAKTRWARWLLSAAIRFKAKLIRLCCQKPRAFHKARAATPGWLLDLGRALPCQVMRTCGRNTISTCDPRRRCKN